MFDSMERDFERFIAEVVGAIVDTIVAIVSFIFDLLGLTKAEA